MIDPIRKASRLAEIAKDEYFQSAIKDMKLSLMEQEDELRRDVTKTPEQRHMEMDRVSDLRLVLSDLVSYLSGYENVVLDNLQYEQEQKEQEEINKQMETERKRKLPSVTSLRR